MFTQTETVIATTSRYTVVKHKVCLNTRCYESFRVKKSCISIWPIISRYFATSIFPYAHGSKQEFYNIILHKQKIMCQIPLKQTFIILIYCTTCFRQHHKQKQQLNVNALHVTDNTFPVQFWPLLPTHCWSTGLLMRLFLLNDTHIHSVELLWTRDRPVAETFTWQHTKFMRERRPCPRQDSKRQS